MQKYFVTLLFSVLFAACVKDKPEKLVQTQVQLSSSKKVFVINEGNYGSGNASFSLYDPETNESIEDLFSSQNNNSAGDVAQSLNFIQGAFYLVINNSKKIIVCDEQFKKIGQINGLVSPRYILPVTNQKAYVSDLYANSISVVDLNSRIKTDAIPCPGKTEQMQLIYNKVFVCNTERSFVYVINTTSDKIEDSIYVGLNASSIVIDKYDRLWILSSGDQKNTTGRLSKINALSHQVEKYWEFGLSESPWNLHMNAGKDSLYYINGDIFLMPIAENQLPQTAFIGKGTRNFYGLGIDPHDHAIYAADAMDYSQPSNIYIYDHLGKEIEHFKAGINANGFYFE